MLTTQELLDFATQLAAEVGKGLLSWFGAASAQTKGDGSYVTEADLEADRLIHQAIANRYPDHGILSEEAVAAYDGCEYTWVVDPLDGTTNFANGLCHWGTSIALLHHGVPLLGVLDFPMLGQGFRALHGAGAWLNGKPLSLQPGARLHENQFLLVDSRSFRHLDICLPAKARILGSAAYDMAGVAAGVALGSLQIMPKIWDLAAAWLIGVEAGATLGTLWPGQGPFPLQQDLDYQTRVFPLLLARDSDLWAEIHQGVALKPGAGELVEHLSSQGWDLLSGGRSLR